MPLTLEERERIAYITNSPDHALIVAAIEAENDALDELRHERDIADQEAKDAHDKTEELEKELEIAEDKIAQLEERIHEAGVDLV